MSPAFVPQPGSPLVLLVFGLNRFVFLVLFVVFAFVELAPIPLGPAKYHFGFECNGVEVGVFVFQAY